MNPDPSTPGGLILGIALVIGGVIAGIAAIALACWLFLAVLTLICAVPLYLYNRFIWTRRHHVPPATDRYYYEAGYRDAAKAAAHPGPRDLDTATILDLEDAGMTFRHIALLGLCGTTTPQKALEAWKAANTTREITRLREKYKGHRTASHMLAELEARESHATHRAADLRVNLTAMGALTDTEWVSYLTGYTARIEADNAAANQARAAARVQAGRTNDIARINERQRAFLNGLTEIEQDTTP